MHLTRVSLTMGFRIADSKARGVVRRWWERM